MAEEKKKQLNTSGRKRVSYSQFSTWFKCPYSYKLAYIDGLSTYENNVHVAFGSAIHEAIQDFLTKLFNEGGREADGFDIIGRFNEVFAKELKGEKKVSVKDDDGNYVLDDNGKKTYKTISDPVDISDDDFDTFTEHGELILKHISDYSNRQKYFPTDKYELAGIEIPINMAVMNNLSFVGYLDIVLREKASGKIKIIDLKTSTRMWNKYQKADMHKIMQLLFYKAFYNQQFGIPLDKIEVEFLVLKRTLMENASFPEGRIQKITPPSGKVMINDAVSTLVQFIENCFTPDGVYNVDGKFRKNPHKGKTKYSNCKYCEFSCKEGGPCDRKEGI